MCVPKNFCKYERKTRNPELNTLKSELEEHTKKIFKAVKEVLSKRLFNSDCFKFVTDIINPVILSSRILESRERFKQGSYFFEKLLVYVSIQEEENLNESL